MKFYFFDELHVFFICDVSSFYSDGKHYGFLLTGFVVFTYFGTIFSLFSVLKNPISSRGWLKASLLLERPVIRKACL